MEVFAITLVTLAFLVYYYYKKSFQYWKNKGIPTSNPSFPFGDLGNFFFGTRGFVSKVAFLHQEFKAKGAELGGVYVGTTPVLLVVHPESIRNVLSKDFQYFNSHGIPFNEKEEPLLAHLFNLEGKRWKDMRTKLTPTFTSGKMKMMFPTLLDCGVQLREFLNDYHHQNKPLDVKEVLACYSTDVIGSCAFGLECNSFKNPNAKFRNYGRRFFRPSIKFQIRRHLASLSPVLMKLLNLSTVDEETTDFFIGAVKDMIDYRQSKNVSRDDFIQLLINLEERAKLEGKEVYTIEEIAAQAFVFFLAGFETSSSTMTFCLCELARNHDIQDKLREEVNRTMKKYDGKLTYDGIMEMKYLDQVIKETLRKYPSVDTLPRACTQNYKLPNGAEIEKGTKVAISVLGLHRDAEYYPDPENFDPDRFSDENKHNIVPYTYLPFGEGPRICIGLRFGIMQVKVGISMLLKNYRIFAHKSLKYPLEFEGNTVVLSAKGTILLTIQKI